MADQIAGVNPPHTPHHFHADAEAVHNALIPVSTWTWHTPKGTIKNSLKHHAQRYNFQQYRARRDTRRAPHDPKGRWTNYSIHWMATLIRASQLMPKHRLSKHLFDWMAHASNLAKSAPDDQKHLHSKCTVCGGIEIQAHENTACRHPALRDL